MSYPVTPERSIVLRLEFSIADAVHQRGLLSVLAAAIAAWWNRPQVPQDLPVNLRADVGLLNDPASPHWSEVGIYRGIPDPLRRPGM